MSIGLKGWSQRVTGSEAEREWKKCDERQVMFRDAGLQATPDAQGEWLGIWERRGQVWNPWQIRLVAIALCALLWDQLESNWYRNKKFVITFR